MKSTLSIPSKVFGAVALIVLIISIILLVVQSCGNNDAAYGRVRIAVPIKGKGYWDANFFYAMDKDSTDTFNSENIFI